MTIHLGIRPGQDDDEPFCGAVRQPGDFLSEVPPQAGACVDCLLLSALAMQEAIARLRREMQAAGEERILFARLPEEERRVRCADVAPGDHP